jgi:hypothetical protein
MPASGVLPAEPLVAAVQARGGVRACVGADGALERAYGRARGSQRLTIAAADKLAVRVLGMHPALLWGDAWWVETDQGPEPVRRARRRRRERPSWWLRVAEQQATLSL